METPQTLALLDHSRTLKQVMEHAEALAMRARALPSPGLILRRRTSDVLYNKSLVQGVALYWAEQVMEAHFQLQCWMAKRGIESGQLVGETLKASPTGFHKITVLIDLCMVLESWLDIA